MPARGITIYGLNNDVLLNLTNTFIKVELRDGILQVTYEKDKQNKQIDYYPIANILKFVTYGL